MAKFRNRREAGSLLAKKLGHYKGEKNLLVLALPRGGVVTGDEIARVLDAPLDVLIVRKIGFPGQPELAAGAVSETGTVALNQSLISEYGVPEKYMRDEIARQKEEIERRVALYRKGHGIGNLQDKTIILVDDGIATGATVKAAISTLRKESIRKLVVAVPVAPPETAEELKALSDEFVCLETPVFFMAVGSHYEDFTQVTDAEVVEMLQKSKQARE